MWFDLNSCWDFKFFHRLGGPLRDLFTASPRRTRTRTHHLLTHTRFHNFQFFQLCQSFTFCWHIQTCSKTCFAFTSSKNAKNVSEHYSRLKYFPTKFKTSPKKSFSIMQKFFHAHFPHFPIVQLFSKKVFEKNAYLLNGSFVFPKHTQTAIPMSRQSTSTLHSSLHKNFLSAWCADVAKQRMGQNPCSLALRASQSFVKRADHYDFLGVCVWVSPWVCGWVWLGVMCWFKKYFVILFSLCLLLSQLIRTSRNFVMKSNKDFDSSWKVLNDLVSYHGFLNFAYFRWPMM